MHRASGNIERHANVTQLKLYHDDVVRIVTANGGGYGDPKLRTLDQIQDDLKNDYLSPERAKEVYGYEVTTE